jgi:hypothetical protein
MRASYRLPAFLLAVFVGGVGVAETLKAGFRTHSESIVRSVVDQAFAAANRIPIPDARLRSALKPPRVDRQAVMASPQRSVTVERRPANGQSVLLRVPAISLAQR